MRTSATSFKIRLGTYLQKVSAEPILIEKNNRTMAVLISIEEYERLTQLEDKYWADRAKAAAAEGFLGKKESMRYIQKATGSKLNAKA